MRSDLRPLAIGEILDAGIKLFIRHWRPLVLSVVLIVLPVQIVSVLVTASVAPEQFDISATETTISEDEETEFFVSQGIIVLLGIFSTLLATAVCFKAVADAYLGAEPDWRRSLRFGARRLGALFVLWFTYSLVVGIGLVLLLVPGIWLGVAFAVSVPALLLERIGPFAALGRSFRLVRGRWWASFGTVLVGFVLVWIIATIVQAIVLAVPTLIADENRVVFAVSTVIGGTVGSIMTLPYTAAVITLMYFDLRVRKEGLDLQLIEEGADVRRDPDAPLPAPFSGGSRVERGAGGERYWSPTPPSPPAWPPPEQPAWRSAPDEPAPGGWLPPRPADAPRDRDDDGAGG
jgi:hypothetical protein